jgi:hypothetical protein
MVSVFERTVIVQANTYWLDEIKDCLSFATGHAIINIYDEPMR